VGSLRERVSEPTEVTNDVNLAALGQAWRGDGIGKRCFVTLSVGTGIGGGVVVDGRLVSGVHNAAGEIGQLVIRVSHQANFSPVAFEQVASGPAIRARAVSLLEAETAESSLAHSDFDTSDVFAAAAAGDPVGRRVIEELLDHIAAAIVNLAAILDPELVILDGSVGRAVEPWLPALSERVAGHVFRPPALTVSNLGPNATLVGAIARALALASENANPKMLTIAKSVSAPPSLPQHDGRADETFWRR
jgi:glucokinase